MTPLDCRIFGDHKGWCIKAVTRKSAYCTVEDSNPKQSYAMLCPVPCRDEKERNQGEPCTRTRMEKKKATAHL
jgi:hypothetical protein